MPLPSGEIPWPPKAHQAIFSDYEEAAAWYSGDPAKLSSIYGSKAEQSAQSRTTQGNGYSALANRMRFWGRRGDNVIQSRQRLHIPVASDIAASSADLLFGEEPTIRIPDAMAANPQADAVAAQERLGEITDQIGLTNLLLEGAEMSAALGGVYLRPSWDLELAPDHPQLEIIHADAAVPDWRGGQLAGVTFWTVLERTGTVVYRLLERHEPGVILTGLYVGSAESLGTLVPLDRHPDSKDLEEQVTLTGELAGRLLPRYVPNVKPNRRHRNKPIGRSDYQGCEGLMDALDETWTSWMRDIRLGQARLVVSEDALTQRGRGEGKRFDADQEIFTSLNFDPQSKAGGDPITPVQFEIRTDQHLTTCLQLFERIVTSAGYSPQTFGLQIDGQAESGTALRVREGKTLKTRGRKARFWVPAIEETLETLLAIDREILGNRDHGVYRPSVDEADVIVANPVEVAQSVSLFRAAQAVSIRTAVRMAQPELDDQSLDAEVERIQEEQALSVPDPTGGFEQ